MFISKKELNNPFWKVFSKYFLSPLNYKSFQKYFGNSSYHKFSIMGFSKFVIYLLNQDSYAKIIILLFFTLKLSISKQNSFLLLLGEKNLEDHICIVLLLLEMRGWRTTYPKSKWIVPKEMTFLLATKIPKYFS